MRLIDADSLIHLVTDSTILGDGFKTAFCALVNGEPTVKVQKTGKWIVHSEIKNAYGGIYIECSECGERYVVQHLDDEIFCRTCGSKNGR